MLCVKHAASLGFRSVLARTQNSDIFFILLHHAENLSTGHFCVLEVAKIEDLSTCPTWLKQRILITAQLLLAYVCLPEKMLLALLKAWEKLFP